MQSLSRSDLYEALDREDWGGASTLAAAGGKYFLTLCGSVSPVTVPEPSSLALRRFRFFFTRQAESGQSGYWLHLGYFASEDETKRWQQVLARIYPAATVRELLPATSNPLMVRPRALTESQLLSLLGTHR